MILIKLIRQILGYVNFTASGGFTERFLNLCAVAHIPLWNVKSINGTIKASTTIKGYKSMREHARNTGIKLRMEKKQGLPFFVYHQKKRVGIVIGVALTVIITTVLSTMLWTIDVQGNKTVTDGEILEVFEELGVKVGCFKKKLDINGIELEASQQLQDLSWLSLNINGSKAVIEVRERTKIPQMIDVKTPCNVVASYGGQIIKYEVYSGLAQQKLTAAVAEGDLLVSGVLGNSDGTERLVHARASVTALTQREITAKSFSTQLVTRIEENKKISKLYFFGIKIPIGFLNKNENARYYETKNAVQAGETQLPVAIIQRGWFTTKTEKEVIDEKQSELMALDNYFCELLNQAGEADIIEQTVEIKKDDGKVEIKGKLKCEEEIGKQQEIYVDDESLN